jgi:hypothetical protein
MKTVLCGRLQRTAPKKNGPSLIFLTDDDIEAVGANTHFRTNYL